MSLGIAKAKFEETLPGNGFIFIYLHSSDWMTIECFLQGLACRQPWAGTDDRRRSRR